MARRAETFHGQVCQPQVIEDDQAEWRDVQSEEITSQEAYRRTAMEVRYVHARATFGELYPPRVGVVRLGV